LRVVYQTKKGTLGKALTLPTPAYVRAGFNPAPTKHYVKGLRYNLLYTKVSLSLI